MGDAYDVAVVGAGTGGYSAAFRAAQLGLRVAMIDAGERLGGTCLLRGCIPTKALLQSAAVMDTIDRASLWGIKAAGEPDWAKVLEFERSVVDKLVKGVTGLAAHRGVEVIRGRAQLLAGPSLEVDGSRIDARDVVLATGSRPKLLPGIERSARIITSDEALVLDRIPASAIVIGAGAVGLEFASIYRSFGADVTLLEALPRLAPLEDEDLSTELSRAFRKRGIVAAAGASVTGIRETDAGVEVTYEVDGTPNAVGAEICLIATGRGPVTDGAGLAEAGVTLDQRGFIVVDDALRTSVEHVWAVGDAAATPLQLAHVAFAEGIAVAERIAGLDVAVIDYAQIPRVTYCTPEIASVGLTEAQARERGADVVIQRLDLRAIGKANILGEGGSIKLVAQADGGPVLGVHIDRAPRHGSDRRGDARDRVGGDPLGGRGPDPPAPVPVRRVRRSDARARRQGAALGLRRTVATTIETGTQKGRPLSDERLHHILYLLKLARYFDERMEALYRQGRLPGAIYSGRGQEGTHVGVVSALEPTDSLFPTHRDLTAQLAKGLELNRVMAQFWGRIDGYTRGRDGNSHIGDWFGNRTFTVMSHLPIAYPVAVGAALAYQRLGDRRVAMAICGDGATSNGRWHEAINTSAVFRLPVVWIVNNNRFAYSTPNALEFSVPTIAERSSAYGIPGVRVDGGEVLEVFEAARVAVERARDGGGPTLIESVSLRWRGHAGHDPAKYMPPEMLEDAMANHDPVKNFEAWMRAQGLLDDEGLASIQARIEREFEEGYDYAMASPFPEPGDVFKGNWTEDGYWTSEPGRDGGTETS